MEAPDQSKCADWREYFSTDEGEKSKEYFVYFEIMRQNQAEKNPPRCARRLTRRFHNKNALCPFGDRGRLFAVPPLVSAPLARHGSRCAFHTSAR